MKMDKLRLGEAYDKRVRLTSEQKEEIIKLYAAGGTQRGIARQYGVHHKTIRLIVNPEAAANDKAYKKENWRNYSSFQSKEERNAARRELRRRKKELYLAGKIGGDTE